MLELKDKTRLGKQSRRVVLTHHQHNRHVTLQHTFIRRDSGARCAVHRLDYSRLLSSAQTAGGAPASPGLGQVNRGGEEEGDDRQQVCSLTGIQVGETVLCLTGDTDLQTAAVMWGV